jgi:hypothetical protein
MYQDAKEFVRRCSRCQKHGSINARDAMPLMNNLQVELFDIWGIGFMGPFPKSRDVEYILVAVNYVSKRVEALPCRTMDSKHSKKMFHEVIFPRFGTPRMVVSDGGSHFIDKTFRSSLLNMESSTTLQLHTTPKQAVKLKHQTSRSRTFCKRPWMRWGRNGSNSCMMHYGRTERHTRRP